MYELKNNYTLVIVTHNMQQAGRVSNKTAFFYVGELVEYNDTKEMFTNPRIQGHRTILQAGLVNYKIYTYVSIRE